MTFKYFLFRGRRRKYDWCERRRYYKVSSMAFRETRRDPLFMTIPAGETIVSEKASH